MSAWLVTREHITALLYAAMDGPKDGEYQWLRGEHRFRWGWDGEIGTLDITNADQVGQLLWDENLKSVNYRYTEENTPEPYTYQRPVNRLTLAEAFKAVHCYDYQSCEHPGWRESSAYHFTRTLARHLEQTLPGYDSAPWGIS